MVWGFLFFHNLRGRMKTLLKDEEQVEGGGWLVPIERGAEYDECLGALTQALDPYGVDAIHAENTPDDGVIIIEVAGVQLLVKGWRRTARCAMSAKAKQSPTAKPLPQELLHRLERQGFRRYPTPVPTEGKLSDGRIIKGWIMGDFADGTMILSEHGAKGGAR